MKKQSKFNRRDFLKAAALTLGATMVGLPRVSLGAEKLPDSIVSMTGSGAYAKAWKAVFSDPWTEKTGVKVIAYPGEPAAVIAKIRANPKKPPIHSIMLPEAMVPDAIKWGILDQMSLETVPNLKDVRPVFHERFENYVCTNNYVFCALLYDKKKIKNPPKTWLEMVDRTIKGEFGKRVSFPSLSYGFAYPFFWVVGKELGDSVEKMDGAFEKFRLMKPFIPKFWTTAVEALQLIEANEADIVAYWEHRAWKFVDQGREDFDVVIPAPGTFEGAVMAKAKNAHPIVFDYINSILGADSQSKWSASMGVHPVNSKAKTSPKMQERYDKTIPKGELFIAPAAEIDPVKKKWLDRWNREIGG